MSQVCRRPEHYLHIFLRAFGALERTGRAALVALLFMAIVGAEVPPLGPFIRLLSFMMADYSIQFS